MRTAANRLSTRPVTTPTTANNDLTFDFGLKPKAIMVGNLVFRDVNANGTFESGIDLPCQT
jgi:hypothetical protein